MTSRHATRPDDRPGDDLPGADGGLDQLPWVAGSPLKRKAAISAGVPLGRVGQPEEIAATVAFLLSEGAGYIDGATIQIDGGKHMH